MRGSGLDVRNRPVGSDHLCGLPWTLHLPTPTAPATAGRPRRADLAARGPGLSAGSATPGRRSRGPAARRASRSAPGSSAAPTPAAWPAAPEGPSPRGPGRLENTPRHGQPPPCSRGRMAPRRAPGLSLTKRWRPSNARFLQRRGLHRVGSPCALLPALQPKPRGACRHGPEAPGQEEGTRGKGEGVNGTVFLNSRFSAAPSCPALQLPALSMAAGPRHGAVAPPAGCGVNGDFCPAGGGRRTRCAPATPQV